MALTVPSGQRQRLSQGLMPAAPEKRPLALKEAARCHLQRLRVNRRSQRALATRLMPPLLRKGRQRPGKRKRGALQARWALTQPRTIHLLLSRGSHNSRDLFCFS